jgi:hypothetical protein
VTRVEVDAGICGFHTVITAERVSPHSLSITLNSDCRMVAACREPLQDLSWKSALRPREEGSVQSLMFRHIRHSGCPVISAVAKAVEVELGAALPADAHIRFVKD